MAWFPFQARRRALACAAAFVVALPACTDSKRPADGAAPGGLSSASLDLQTLAEFIKTGAVEDASGLERALNDPEAGVNHVDVDGDGTVDPLRVVETREGDTRLFSLTATSSTGAFKDTNIARLGFVIDGRRALGELIYAEAVPHDDAHNASFEYDLAGDDRSIPPFVGWALASNRPIYGGRAEVHIEAGSWGARQKRHKKHKKPKKHKKQKKDKKGK